MVFLLSVSHPPKNLLDINIPKSEKTLCPTCHRPFRIITHSKPRYVEGMQEDLAITTYYYGCRRKNCSDQNRKLMAITSPLTSPRSTLTTDIKAKICEWRWKDHKTYLEIQRELLAQYQIRRSLRGVELILKEYEESCAIFISESAKQKILANKRIILSIDGMKPLNGEEGIYAAFDLLSNTPLGCSLLAQQSEYCIVEFLQSIMKRLASAGIDVPIVATISDAWVGQRLGLEKALKGAKICLCHFHFYELISKSARQADSAAITKVRSALRRFYYLAQYKRFIAQHESLPWCPAVVHLIELLLSLSNFRIRPQDHCFNSPEYLAKLQNLVSLADSHLNSDTNLSQFDRKVLEKFSKKFSTLLSEYSALLLDIAHIREYIKQLQAILDADESAEVGELKLVTLNKQWKTRLNTNRKHLGTESRTFLLEATKFMSKKISYLMNYRRVADAPKTNNRHEQRYHRIKYKLRRTIGHVAAKHFLKKHGNTILFVNPDATHEEIVEILSKAPISEVRKRIRENRKSRNSLDQCIYDQEKWDAELAKLKKAFDDLKDLKKGLT